MTAIHPTREQSRPRKRRKEHTQRKVLFLCVMLLCGALLGIALSLTNNRWVALLSAFALTLGMIVYHLLLLWSRLQMDRDAMKCRSHRASAMNNAARYGLMKEHSDNVSTFLISGTVFIVLLAGF